MPFGEVSGGEAAIRLSSVAQQRLWFLHSLQPESPGSHVCAGWRLEGQLDPGRLQQALRLVVAQHAALRTAFDATAIPVRQVVYPDVAIHLPLEMATDDRQLEALVRAAVTTPFDLSQPPLWRIRLLRRGPLDHLLLLVAPEIVADRRSLHVVARALLSPDQRLLVADRPRVARRPPDEATRTELVRYWTDALSGVVPVLDLPADHPRLRPPTHLGIPVPLRIGDRVLAGLRRAADAENTSLTVVLLAVYALLLRTFTGRHELILGLRDRGPIGCEDEVGCRDDLLPIAVAVNDTGSFRDLVRAIRDRARGAQAHSELGFGQLVETLELPRDVDRHPLVQAVFQLHRIGPPASTDALVITPAAVAPAATRFDVEIDLADADADADDCVRGQLVCSADVADTATAESLARTYLYLAEMVAGEPDERLGTVSLVDPVGRRLLQQLNDTAVALPDHALVAERVSRQAERTPDAVAIVGAGDPVTYRRLDRLANGFAQLLVSLGAGPGRVVGVCAQRTASVVVAYLAAWKAGAAYLPLDPAAPTERLAAILHDASPTVLVTDRDDVPAGAWVQLDIEVAGDRELDGLPADAARPARNDLAYIFYTSGSTGRPKGVGVEHASLRNIVDWHVRSYEVTGDDIATWLTGQGFDASIADIWPNLVAGAMIALPGDELIRLQPAQLAEWLRAVGATVCFLPTPLAEAFLAQAPAAVGRLRCLLTGGDRLIHRPPAGLAYRVVNQYGPTETTVWAVVAEVGADPTCLPPIGRPISNVRAYVVDEHRRLLPLGAVGELFLAGVNLARGYLNRPALTADRFLPDPFAGTPGARMYNTGDLARWGSDLQLHYLGRSDGQVKIRGVRVEVGEIEAALRRHPAIDDVTVLANGAHADRRELVAFIVPSGELSDAFDALDFEALRRYLCKQLPREFVPTRYVPVEGLPLTGNGKVNRLALAAVPLPPESDRPIRRPETTVEEALVRICASVLDKNLVSLDDNFFSLGGDSLLAMQVVAEAADRGLQVSLLDVFESATLDELAVRAAAAADLGPDTGPVPAPPLIRWFWDGSGPAGRGGYQAAVLPCQPGQPGTDIDALRRAVHDVVEWHDALRLRGDVTGMRVCGAEWARPYLERFDLSGLADHARPAAVSEHAARLATRLDPVKGPTVVVGYGTGDDAGAPAAALVLVLVLVHRLCVDAGSWPVLLEDLAAACRARVAGSEPQLPQPSTTFAAWARALDAGSRRVDISDDLPYWANVLRLPQPRLPVRGDRGAAAAPPAEGSSPVIVRAPADLAAALMHDANAAYRTTAEELLLAALSLTARDVLGLPELLIHVDTDLRLAGHHTPGSRAVGWYEARFPLRFDTATDPGAAVVAVKEARRRIPDNPASYGVLRYATPLSATGPAAAAVPEVRFTSVVDGSAARPAESRIEDGCSRWGHSLDVSVICSPDGLQARFDADPGVLDAEQLADIAQSYRRALAAVIQHCCVPDAGRTTPSDFPLFARLKASHFIRRAVS